MNRDLGLQLSLCCGRTGSGSPGGWPVQAHMGVRMSCVCVMVKCPVQIRPPYPSGPCLFPDHSGGGGGAVGAGGVSKIPPPKKKEQKRPGKAQAQGMGKGWEWMGVEGLIGTETKQNKSLYSESFFTHLLVLQSQSQMLQANDVRGAGAG